MTKNLDKRVKPGWAARVLDIAPDCLGCLHLRCLRGGATTGRRLVVGRDLLDGVGTGG